MTSERTISQVRAILNKLDRSIDEARARRRQGPTPAPSQTATPSSFPPSPQSLTPSPKPASPAPAPGTTAAPSTSGFGRAQPLRPQATNMLRFNQH